MAAVLEIVEWPSCVCDSVDEYDGFDDGDDWLFCLW